MQRIVTLALGAAFAVCFLAMPETLAMPGPGPQKGSTLTIVNDTDWTIHHLYLSPSDHESWGPDQLQENVLAPDESITLKGIPCDLYDIRVVDEDGDWCVVQDVDLCKVKAGWVISNDLLSACDEIGNQ
jgi:hypothetical protein